MLLWQVKYPILKQVKEKENIKPISLLDKNVAQYSQKLNVSQIDSKQFYSPVEQW